MSDINCLKGDDFMIIWMVKANVCTNSLVFVSFALSAYYRKRSCRFSYYIHTTATLLFFTQDKQLLIGSKSLEECHFSSKLMFTKFNPLFLDRY